jgi:16S rRNA C967 or C1407 C5-methylase (RsmB/RsmF family)/NOL1/NOP2/fmu family ribosome biogenesis protein
MQMEWAEDWPKLEANLLNSDSTTSIQINRYKNAELNWNAPQVSWYDRSMKLGRRPVFADDPLWHAGAYYVQEASSMFLAHALSKLMLPLRAKALDLCAAPGGKSLLIQNVLGSEISLVSNEIHPVRNSILQENIQKWGHGTAIITQGEAKNFQSSNLLFDLVLVDAPCSGEGMFRKDLKARQEWSLGLVNKCALRQRDILESISECINEGGYLVYSTCTFAREENEDQIEMLLESGDWEGVNLEVPENWGIVETQVKGSSCYRFFPHKIESGEGLFLSVLRRITPSRKSVSKKRTGSGLSKISKTESEICESWIGNDMDLISHRNELFLLRNEQRMLAEEAFNHLRVVQPGTPVGEIKGKDFVPSHALAMLSDKQLSIPVVELDEEDALVYLRKHNPNPNLFSERGYNFVSHKGIVLGAVKMLGNRVNNYYPKSWRLLRQ